MKNIYLTMAGVCLALSSYAQLGAQPQKKIAATRTQKAPKIDGVIEEIWNEATIADKFIQTKPTPYLQEPEKTKTQARFLYDDVAIYVAAKMFEHPDSIKQELVTRDNIGNADFFGVIFDTFKDGINGTGFFVTAAGVQFDAKYSQTGNEDPRFNAVWESAVSKDSEGWVVEMKIPYSALRFNSKEIQDWGVNMVRKRAGVNQQLFWNQVDPKVNGFINQSGILTDLKDIKAPLRLSFMPYISTFVSHYPNNTPGIKNTVASINGGMDLKYGINQSYTLDLTLIPDFGQVQSDNRILNLTPFEVRFDENRQFFTEGTELFNKGDLFYSRRIGNSPKYYHNIDHHLRPGEKIKAYPTESKLLNATKISGRGAKGLGIGFFNAITDKMHAEIEDASGGKRIIENQPLTNYNVIVLDQNLKNSSSVSVVNTNVIRQGSAYDANTTAFLFRLKNKSQRYALNGDLKMSYITNPNGKDENGYSYRLNAGKQSGSFTWMYTLDVADQKFDPSDMGYYTNNNFLNHYAEFNYNVVDPGKWYNQMQSWIGAQYSQTFKGGNYQSFDVFSGYFVEFKNFWNMQFIYEYSEEGNDYYESRGRGMYIVPSLSNIGLFFNSNRAKSYSLGGNIKYLPRKDFGGRSYNFYLYNNLRLSDKVSFGLSASFNPGRELVNWVTNDANRSIFSKYDRNTVESVFNTKYTFTNKMGLSARVRHYWSDRRNSDFYQLNSSGRLDAYNGPTLNNTNRNYNVFNIDLIYSWVFAPGSELSVAYKNSAETNEYQYRKGYFKNFDNTISSPQNNSLSIKLLYYLDYLDFKKKKK